LDEGIELLRRHYADDDEQQLLNRAMYWRSWIYQHGRRPADQEIIAEKAKAAAEAKAYADAERAAVEAEADAA
jgi:hypothetical protein